jgi:hypothetical protein
MPDLGREIIDGWFKYYSRRMNSDYPVTDMPGLGITILIKSAVGTTYEIFRRI